MRGKEVDVALPESDEGPEEPQELSVLLHRHEIDALNTWAEENGRSVSKVVQNALRRIFGWQCAGKKDR